MALLDRLNTWKMRTALHMGICSAMLWAIPFVPNATVKGEWGGAP